MNETEHPVIRKIIHVDMVRREGAREVKHDLSSTSYAR
jgi:hypothetical protein